MSGEPRRIIPVFSWKQVLDNDTSSAIQIGDTLKNSGTTSYVLRSLPLLSSLSGRHNVRFRWRVVGNGAGASGTLRIDNVEVTVDKRLDLALTGIDIEPAKAREGETLFVHARVANRALGSSLSFKLQLFDNKDSDSLVTEERKVGEQALTHLFGVADSATFTFTVPPVLPGSHRFSVRLSLPGDEDTTNNTLRETIFVGYSPRSVLINEIMYAPSGGPEWIECVNNSVDTISLSQWKVGDNTTSRAVICIPKLHALFPGNFLSSPEILQSSTIMHQFRSRLSRQIFPR